MVGGERPEADHVGLWLAASARNSSGTLSPMTLVSFSIAELRLSTVP